MFAIEIGGWGCVRSNCGRPILSETLRCLSDIPSFSVQDKKEEKGTALLGLTLKGMQVYQVRACALLTRGACVSADALRSESAITQRFGLCASTAVKPWDEPCEECAGSPPAALQREIGAVYCSRDLFDLSVRGPSGGD